MKPRVVYDSMLFFQWAALSPQARRGTVELVETGKVVLCLSADLVTEVRELLARPAIRAKSSHLTDGRVASVLALANSCGAWFTDVPSVFRHSRHSDDDHIFNLAIVAKADFLVTWEERHLRMAAKHPDDMAQLRNFAPALRIVDPPTLLRDLRQFDTP